MGRGGGGGGEVVFTCSEDSPDVLGVGHRVLAEGFLKSECLLSSSEIVKLKGNLFTKTKHCRIQQNTVTLQCHCSHTK